MKNWHLMAYDIREPRRLRRVHYRLSKKALALQNSVFLIHADETTLKSIVNEVKEIADNREDDIRLYPVIHPNNIWASGKQAGALSNLYTAAPGNGKTTTKGFFGNLFAKLKRRE